MSLMCNISNLNLLYYPLSPYVILNQSSLAGNVADAYQSLIKGCCADASGIMYQNLMFPNMTTMLFAYQSMFASSAVAMPVFSIYAATSVPAPPNYVQVVVLPAFIQIASPVRSDGATIIQTAIRVWPIIVTIWGFTGLVAYILWFVENYISKDKSPYARTFGRGILDSFWNSFITAGTIGYGDMVVKSQLGRFVIVLWINLSILMFSVLTGTFTSLLTAAQASTSSFPSISGSTVGVLYNSVEKNLVVQAGGYPTEMTSLPVLVDGVLSGQVSSALINMLTYLDQFSIASTGLAKLRQQVVNQFSASVGFMFGNSYSTFSSALSTCMQEQSLTFQLILSGQWSEIAQTLNQNVAIGTYTSSSLSMEMGVAIGSVCAPMLFVVVTFFIYTFCCKKPSKVDPVEPAESHKNVTSNAVLEDVELDQTVATTAASSDSKSLYSSSVWAKRSAEALH